MSADADLVLEARGAFRLGAVAVSHGWFQTAPFCWDPEGGRLRAHGAARRTGP